MAKPAQSTQESPHLHLVEEASPTPRPTLDIPEGASGSSPAVALQKRLVSAVNVSEEKYPARYVTATVIVTCLSCWYAVYMLANALI